MDWNELKYNKEEEKEKVIKEKKPIQFTTLSDAEKKRGLKIGIYGDFATGKTHFALTAPEPIFIIDTEMGAPPLSHLFKGKDIRIIDVAESDGVKSYEKFCDAVDYIIKQKTGTVIVDSITDLWSFTQEYAKVKIFKIKPEQRLAQQWDWGVINKLYQTLLLKLIRMNCNLIVTAREGEVYERAGQPSGIYKPSWQKKTGFWLDFVLRNKKSITKEGGLNFTSLVEKSRPVGGLMGKTFPNIDFVKFVEEVNKKKE